MASKELTETIEARTIATEDKMLSLLNSKREYLEKELEIRSKLSFNKVKPDFEYENEPEYLEHIKAGLKISVDEQLLSIEKTLDGIYNQRDERKELNTMRNK